MPLRPTETAQCECCEEYVRLRQLANVTIKDNEVQVTRSPKFDSCESPYIGDCPKCGMPIFARHVT